MKTTTTTTTTTMTKQNVVNEEIHYPTNVTCTKNQRRQGYESQKIIKRRINIVTFLLHCIVLFLNTNSNTNSNTNTMIHGVSAYSTGAGACPFNQSAVRDSHLNESNGKVIIRRGQQLRRLGIELRIDDKPINSSTTTLLDPNIDYTIEVIATGGGDGNGGSANDTVATAKAISEGIVSSFKGALVRIEMTKGQNVFDFKPVSDDDSGATVAIKCSLPAVGITHSSAKPRSSIKGIVNFQSFGTVQIDVTVVVVNNNSTSNFAYTAYPNIKVRKVGLNTTSTPTAAVQTFFPTITPIPTITQSPSYSERCYLCSDDLGNTNADYILANKGITFEFVNVVTTCGELENTALTQSLPPLLCDVAKEAVQTNGCSCVAPGTPIASPATTTTGIAITPAVQTQRPTYETKCYICNGDISQSVTNLDAIVTLPTFSTSGTSSTTSNTDTTQLTCDRLQRAALSGRISPTLCTALTTINVTVTCACQFVNPPSSPIASSPTSTVPVPSPSTTGTSGTGGGITFAPSITRKPTISKAPLLSSSLICYGCSTSQQIIIDRSRVVTYFGYKYTCGQLFDVQGRISYMESSCLTYQNTIQQQCGCQPITDFNNGNIDNNINNSPNSSPSVALQTFAPTITQLPTITQMPSYTDLCYVCGSDDTQLVVTNPDDTVAVKGRLYTCGKIYRGGIDGHIPPLLCHYFVEAALRDCNCQIDKSQTNKKSAGVKTITTLSSPITHILISILVFAYGLLL